jgi:hypothetical protein
MVPLIIVYFHSRMQFLLRRERIGGHFFGQKEGLCAPFFGDAPPTSTSFLKSSSTERVRRSTPRAGLRAGDPHQPQISDASRLPQRLYGTCQWWHCWLSVFTQTTVLPADKLQRLCQGLAASLDLLLKDCPGYTLLTGEKCSPGTTNASREASGPPTSRRTRPHISSSRPERRTKGISVDTTPITQATHPTWIKGNGRRTGLVLEIDSGVNQRR